jgi:hypothetical protein
MIRLRPTVFKVGKQMEDLVVFIYSLLNNAFSSSSCIAADGRLTVNNELERMWKVAIVA